VAGAAPYIETQGLITAERREPALIRGVLPAEEGKVSVIAEKMVQGRFDELRPGSFNIILGKELALWLGARVGDKVVVLTDMRATPMGAMPQLKRFTVSGLFEAGYQEYDRNLALINMVDAQKLSRSGDGVTGVRLKLNDRDQSWNVARDLAIRLGGGYRVSDWSSENANMFRALKLEKTMMAILLSLIVAMGAFNLVSSQVMLVTDKQADIAILRTLGLAPKGVMQIFMVQGTLIGVIGTVMGVIGGIVLTLNLEHILRGIERLFAVQLMPEDVYYITGLPTELQTSDVVTIAIVALVMSFLATIYPAWRASRTAPAEALRYE
ncbi:MAG TPA: FtsX-like permease family protein, partial [Luteimonas sp.]|nr:FtsX-like permease family protein [Luteimonas sp.]